MRGDLHTLSLQIYQFFSDHQVKLLPVWIPRSQNCMADVVSRYHDWDDWAISPQLYRWVTRKWVCCTIDVCAKHLNHKCPRFYSKYFCPGTSGVKCFACDWRNQVVLACTPPSLVPHVINHFTIFGSHMILVILARPSATYWPWLEKNNRKQNSPPVSVYPMAASIYCQVLYVIYTGCLASHHLNFWLCSDAIHVHNRVASGCKPFPPTLSFHQYSSRCKPSDGVAKITLV